MTVINDIHSLQKILESIKNNEPVYLTSGGFDPLHVGHLRCIQETILAASCKYKYPTNHKGTVVVIVNTDEFLLKKKGYVFMPLKERMEIINSISGVDYVVPWKPINNDLTVCEPIRILKPKYFAKGGDRKNIESIPEWPVCKEVGCEVLTGVGGGKIQHSSQLVESAYYKIASNPDDLYIFDFDRTLCHCKGKVYITDTTTNECFTLTPTEYADWREEAHHENYPGRFELDFRDFDGYPTNGMPILDTFRRLKKALKSKRTTVAIVTGRGETKGPKDWLKDQGINVNKMVFLASNGPDKRPCYDSLFNTYTTKQVYIFEDAQCYIDQCLEMCEKHSLNLISYLIPEVHQ